MESKEHSPGFSTPDGGSSDAQALLSNLAADRAALAGRLAAPGWLYPAFGVIAALYVASAGIGTDSIRYAVAGLAVAASLVLLWSYQRISGVRVSRVGIPGRLTIAVLVGAILVLLSTSLGLASLGLHWWIAIPTVVSFGLVVILGRLFDNLYRGQVRRGR